MAHSVPEEFTDVEGFAATQQQQRIWLFWTQPIFAFQLLRLPENTTPVIDSLAKEGALWEDVALSSSRSSPPDRFYRLIRRSIKRS
jgi:hypothetical protein